MGESRPGTKSVKEFPVQSKKNVVFVGFFSSQRFASSSVLRLLVNVLALGMIE